ncbi:uncharacterized protein C3orf67 homolog [Anneissia japonica]|uniref:uncharacterized protein C3orf67 homolog n=1 Tax=Anneissia japonica TaxID=1529436 RepID=UPI00142588F2|nr:uncharacterized protein C3orf67 homolog [Anneissia japonica]XP_033105569.1 uncharacterized protein C3orf67 homolog [Anneissia japonica]XP_033105570.1 uncharacterized protein C3orf67 homolog [Anneissia japonica]XP_033105571.1 uncharacterized protein C3orf67 homolog [Anneissia japonica]XP_033105572.1 uncharacterized protein C3orf67 homolog [Anneissia japonica]
MFKNEFQGGPYVDVFSSQGKEPLAKWKLSGGATSFKKVYDKEIKSYCHVVEGSTASTKMQLPKDPKHALCLIQRFFVIQLFVSLGQDFSVELGICDMCNNKRRIVLSTSHKEVSVTPLHAKIPLAILRKAVWLNLCLDMVSFVGEAFKGQTFKSLDSITISATCKLRKIFTLKVQPLDNTDDDDLYICSPLTNDTEVDHIPVQCQFHKDVPFQTQVINMNKLRHADYKMRGELVGSRPSSSSEPDLNASRGKDKGPTHIAFGSRVRVPSSPSTKKPTSASNREGSNSAGHRSSRTSKGVEESPRGRSSRNQVDTLVVHSNKHTRQRSDPGTPVTDAETSVDKDSLSGSKTWSGGGDIQSEIIRKPHPPREKSRESGTRRVVKVRPSSGNKSSNSSSRSGSGDVTARGVYDKNKYMDHNESSRRNRNESGSSVDLEDDVRKLLNGARERLTKQDWNDTENFGRAQNNSSSPHRSKLADSMSESDDMLALSGDSISLRSRSKKPSKIRDSRHRMESFSENDEKTEKNACNSNKQSLSKVERTNGGAIQERNLDKMAEGVQNDDHPDEMEKENLSLDTVDGKLYTFTSKPRPVQPRKDVSLKDTREKKNVNGHNYNLKVQFTKPQDDDFFGDQSGEEDDNYHVVIKKSSASKRVEDESMLPSEKLGELTVDNVNNSQRLPQKSHSPRMSRAHKGHGPGKRSRSPKHSKDSRHSTSRMSVKWLKEISKDDPRLSSDSKITNSSYSRSSGKKSTSGSSENKVPEGNSVEGLESRLSDDYDWRNDRQSNSSSLASSLEANMLRSLQRQQLEEALEEDSSEDHIDAFHGIDADVSDSSDDSATTASTWQRPAPAIQPYDYMGDTHQPSRDNPLMQSNPRDWSKMFSPPIVPVSERIREEQTAAVQLSPDKDTSPGEKGLDDSDEELDLLYDPCLNCYFDPKTHKYYELA